MVLEARQVWAGLGLVGTARLGRAGYCWAVLGWVGQSWTELARAGQGWSGLDRAGQAWTADFE